MDLKELSHELSACFGGQQIKSGCKKGACVHCLFLQEMFDSLFDSPEYAERSSGSRKKLKHIEVKIALQGTPSPFPFVGEGSLTPAYRTHASQPSWL